MSTLALMPGPSEGTEIEPPHDTSSVVTSAEGVFSETDNSAQALKNRAALEDAYKVLRRTGSATRSHARLLTASRMLAGDWNAVEQGRSDLLLNDHLQEIGFPARLDLHDLPATHAEALNTLKYDPAADTLTRAARETAADYLLVVISPSCNVCRRAALDIARWLQVNQPRYGRCLVFVTSPGVSMDFRALARWQAIHPQLDTRLFTQWLSLSLDVPTEYPLIHWVSQGRARDTLVGWPDASRLQDLQRLLESRQARCIGP